MKKEFKGAIDLRDIKRRPKSYKTGQSSTYTEKIRELIDFQMSLMKEFAEREAEVSLIEARDRHQSEKKKKKKKRSKHESDDDDDDELDGQARHRSHKKKSKKRKSRKSSRSESPTDLVK